MAKKSRHVPALLVSSVAAVILSQGCSPDITEVRRCVDSTGEVLPDNFCDTPAYYPSGYHGYIYLGRPVYVFGGGGGMLPGGRASGYSYTQTYGSRIVNSSGRRVGGSFGSSIKRNGFGGSSVGSHGSFGSFGG